MPQKHAGDGPEKKPPRKASKKKPKAETQPVPAPAPVEEAPLTSVPPTQGMDAVPQPGESAVSEVLAIPSADQISPVPEPVQSAQPQAAESPVEQAAQSSVPPASVAMTEEQAPADAAERVLTATAVEQGKEQPAAATTKVEEDNSAAVKEPAATASKDDGVKEPIGPPGSAPVIAAPVVDSARASRIADLLRGSRLLMNRTPELPPEPNINDLRPDLREPVIKMRNPKINVRMEGVASVRCIKDAEVLIPSLLRRLKDRGEEDCVRYCVPWMIGKMGEKAKIAVPFLIEALRDRCDEVKRYSAVALGNIGDPSALSELEHAIRQEQDFVTRKDMKAAILKLKGRK